MDSGASWASSSPTICVPWPPGTWRGTRAGGGFNPFDAPIVQQVLDDIVESLRRAPRPAWLILYAAACHEVADKCGMFVAIAQFPLSRGPFWTLPGPGRDSIVCTNRSRDGELLA
jgi:hypothetical protein